MLYQVDEAYREELISAFCKYQRQESTGRWRMAIKTLIALYIESYSLLKHLKCIAKRRLRVSLSSKVGN
jgi:hypothetical protein